MENAAKALRIAAGVIIGLLLVALLWYVYHQFVEIPRQEEANAKVEEMVEFNKRYMAYNKESIKGNKIISLMNMANDNNTTYSDVEDYKINIAVKLKSGAKVDIDEYKNNIKKSEQEYQRFIDNIRNKYFKCEEVKHEGPNGRISKMTFQEI